MRGVPANLPLQPFVGQTLIQVSLGEFQLQFHFSEAGCISVEGNWQLVDSSGGVVASRHGEQGKGKCIECIYCSV